MTWRNRNLYLIGLPGSGKSAIGRELSAMLDRFEFVDLDREIECKAGRTIPEIFASDGEQRFRKLESELLLQIASARDVPKIIATGGGVVLNPTNRAIIRGSGVPIWIDVTVREAARNIWNDIANGNERPLFVGSSADEIRTILTRLLEERRPWYEQSVLHFVRRTQRNEHTPQELASELLTALDKMSLSVALKPKHRTVIAKSALGDYPIFIGSGIASREIGYYLREQGFNAAFIVTDNNVAALHFESFISGVRQFTGDKIAFYPIRIQSGERYKNLETLQTILQEFHNYRASRRSSIVIGLGGGVVTDITALAANLYHRGLPVALVPTTLIGQVDAAIGGKTGIDAFGNKNMIGTFYPPRIIAVDPLYIRTLPDRERNAGLAEVLKYALIGDRAMWERLSSELPRLLRGTNSEYDEIIFRSIKGKLRYVEQDEFEQTFVRELLNFGHTFGHALEAATNFEVFLHGEAVLVGMRAAVWLSNKLGYLADDESILIESVLRTIPIEVSKNTDTENMVRAFERDKKGSGRVILLRSIGEAFATQISAIDARRSIEAMLSFA